MKANPSSMQREERSIDRLKSIPPNPKRSQKQPRRQIMNFKSKSLLKLPCYSQKFPK